MKPSSGDLVAWRRHLHAHPGLTLHEEKTAAFVLDRLCEMGVEAEGGVGGHGVVATIRGRGGDRASNRSVGLRADMDALPIQELNPDLPHRSTVPGVMHACGHDGHTAALLGAAALLKADPDWSGTVRLVFQPAEEGGGGARSMIEDGLFARFPMERIFGWHNWPGLAAGTVAVHDGPVMAAGARFEIAFEGRAGHAALPHLTRDPMLGAGHCIVALQSLVARNVDPLDAAVVSVTVAEAGEAQNQVPQRAVLKGTMRFLRGATGDALEEGIRRIAEGVATSYQLRATVNIRRGVEVTANHPAERDMAAGAAEAVSALRRDLPPAMTGEDFSWFLREVPGAFVWIGNGEGRPDLHNPGYDFNDDILPVASRWLAEVAKRALSAPR
ncbi:MAG: amidohydrolase [Acetobacteraceae bacterium]|nr:amidohydrolase [Acetobacteraceae bacterium]